MEPTIDERKVLIAAAVPFVTALLTVAVLGSPESNPMSRDLVLFQLLTSLGIYFAGYAVTPREGYILRTA